MNEDYDMDDYVPHWRASPDVWEELGVANWPKGPILMGKPIVLDDTLPRGSLIEYE